MHLKGKYVKSNALVSASYKLSVIEQQLLVLALVSAQKIGVITDQKVYEVSAQDIAEMTGKTIKSCFESLKDAVDKLMSRVVTLYDDGVRGHKTSWVQSAHYDYNSATVKVRFSFEILPYITNLSKRFTVVYLFEGSNGSPLSFASAYSFRVLELLSQWAAVGQFTITVDELRKLLNLETKYPKMHEFKRRVITKSIEEINTKTQFEVTVSDLKQGRYIKAFKFNFTPPASLREMKMLHSPITEEMINASAKVGETREQVKKRLQKAKYDIAKACREVGK